jgi:hypothetical protein
LSAVPEGVQGQFIRVKAQKTGSKGQSEARLAQILRVFDSLILMTRQALLKKAELLKSQQNWQWFNFGWRAAIDEPSLLRHGLKLKSLIHEK